MTDAAAAKKIRVLVIDDSAYNRRSLSAILGSSDRIEVVGSAFDGEDAIRKIMRLKPDAITLDLEMPRMDGFALLRWLMINHPLPVFVVSARESNRSVFKALDLGAADFIVKPQSPLPRMELIRDEIIGKIVNVEKFDVSKLVQRLRDAPRLQPTGALTPLPEKPAPVVPAAAGVPDGVIVIAASTGGPPAVQQVLSGLVDPSRVAVVIAQHMPPVFTTLFAERLDKLMGLRVKEASLGEPLLPGCAYVLPGAQNGALSGSPEEPVIRLRDKATTDRYAPSADLLFESAAAMYGKRALGVVLTGMGDDGARGSRALLDAGGAVLAESKETAVIFGMPQEALRHAGAKALPLTAIAGAASQWCEALPRTDKPTGH
jgi:two-component system chemotaxis response regulator CheB